MAFDIEGFDKSSSAANTGCPVIWCYVNEEDTISEISASNYFLPLYQNTSPNISVEEMIYVKGSDGITMLVFDVVSSGTVSTDTFIPAPSADPDFIAGTVSLSEGGFVVPELTFISRIFPIIISGYAVNTSAIVSVNANIGFFNVSFTSNPGAVTLAYIAFKI